MQNRKNDLSDRLLDFAADIVKLLSKLNKSSASYHVGDQLFRSATSAGAN